MSANLSIYNPSRPKRVLMLVSNPAVSEVTGWPIGVWISELVHPYWEFKEHGYQVDIASPQGGALAIDAFSDPRHESGYSADDILSLGFLSSPAHAALIETTLPLDQVVLEDYDALFVCGGQGPMVTFIHNPQVHQLFARAYEAGKVTAAICHGTCILLKTTLANGDLLVKGKTWTGFANSEEVYAEQAAGTRLQPFWIETEARQLPDTNFINGPAFAAFAVRDGNLITGQQQFSGAAAARLVITALGV